MADKAKKNADTKVESNVSSTVERTDIPMTIDATLKDGILTVECHNRKRFLGGKKADLVSGYVFGWTVQIDTKDASQMESLGIHAARQWNTTGAKVPYFDGRCSTDNPDAEEQAFFNGKTLTLDIPTIIESASTERKPRSKATPEQQAIKALIAKAKDKYPDMTDDAIIAKSKAEWASQLQVLVDLYRNGPDLDI